MRVLVVAYEFPYPPNSGGRSDIWRRLKALHSLGIEVMLVAWAYENSGLKPSAQQIEAAERILSRLIVLDISDSPLRRGIRLLKHPRLPWPALCRVVKDDVFQDIQSSAREFKPDIVLFEGLFGYGLAEKLSSNLNVPLLYRSQNIEYEFASRLMQAATGVKEKLRLMLYLNGLKRYEQRAIQNARLVHDISMDGADFWQKKGYAHVQLFAPFLDGWESSNKRTTPKVLEPKFMCGYLGNLYSPANIFGIKWFCDHVLKLLPDDSKVLIAGSRPTEDIIKYLSQFPKIELWQNPESIEEVYGAVQVLINPIFHGSGVSIKTVDMIASGKPVVSTSLAKRGLSAEVCQGLFFGDSPSEFAKAVLRGATQEGSQEDLEKRQKIVGEQFGQKAIERFGASLRDIARDRSRH